MENRDIPDLSTPLPRSNNNEEVYDVNLEETSVPDEFMKPLYMSTTEPVNDNEYEDDVFNASLGRFMIAVKSPDYQYTSTPEPVDDERVPSDEYDDDEMFDESLGRIMVSIKSPHYQIRDVANRSNNDDPNPDTVIPPALRDDERIYEEFLHALDTLELPDEQALNPDVHEEEDPFEDIFHGIPTQEIVDDRAPTGEVLAQERIGNREASSGQDMNKQQVGSGTGPTVKLQRRQGNRVIHILDYSAPVGSHVDVMTVIQQSEDRITRDVNNMFNELGTYSGNVYLSLTISLEKLTVNGSETNRFYINTPVVLIERERIHELFDTVLNYLPNVLEERLGACEGSGWRINALDKLAIIYTQRGLANIRNYTDYPKGLRGNHQIVNIRSGYNCLITCLLAYKILTKKPDIRKDNLTRAVLTAIANGKINVKYDPETEIDMRTVRNIEKMNELNIFIYKLSEVRAESGSGDKWAIHLARRGGNPTSSHLVTLLLINNDHVVLVRDMISFVNSFCHKLRTSKKPVLGLCYNCLTLFTSPQIKQAHTATCSAKTTVKYPDPGKSKYFRNLSALHKTSHVAFLDLEAYNVYPDADEDPRITAKQKAYAYCYTIVDGRSGDYCMHRIGHGDDCINTMLRQLKKDWAEIRNNIPMYEIKMTARSWQKYQETSHCQVCNVKFGGQVIKVRHHAHHLREDNYVAALCKDCNLKIANKPKTLTVLVHNLSYDICLILKESCPKIHFDILKRDGGKYYSARTGVHYKFTDSEI
ncbi:uncharacterized protein LOC135208137 [Macrobrachium nipponense]|uniref:uncharacterized protein LOC135208137 n=1 Tax=Macrobrachium nipponense TaxID=159736 RepID=UPI0030C81F3F